MRAAVLAFLVAASPALAAGQQRPPARDADVRPTVGTGSISGVVVTDETPPQPARRVVVTLTGADLRPSRGAITDDDGRFTLKGLPTGRFILTAMRPAFVTSAYGAKRAGRPGTPVSVTEGQTQQVIVRLWRGAVIAGVLRDEMGEPVANVPVTATRVRGSAGGPGLTLTNNGAATNDRGEYRIFGLEPGTYVVSARPSSGSQSPMLALPVGEIDAAFDALRARTAATGASAVRPPEPTAAKPFEHAPVYYPGTASRGDAAPIALVAGQEAVGMDFALQRVATLIVEGQVMRPDGQPAAGAEVQLTPIGALDFATEQQSVINVTANASGTFRFTQVTPGDYTLFTRAPAVPAPPRTTGGVVSAGPQGTQLWASTPVSVNSDVSGLSLSLQRPLTMSGRVRFESADRPAPSNLAPLRMMLFPPNLQNVRSGMPIRSIAMVSPGAVRDDGTFEIGNVVPGRYVLTAIGTPFGAAWWPRSAMLGGRDLLDGAIEITSDMNLTGVELTYTDRRSELSGRLQTASGDAASDVFVIAFAADRRFWGPNARRVQAVRPGVDGGYVIGDLPAGEYLIAALTDVDQDEWQDPAFLERLQAVSVKVTIADGEKKTLDLRIGG